MNWAEFAEAAPDLARFGEERFKSTGLALVGTVRKDGAPRISPVEPLIADGQLYLGMMWRSRKALDLLRDPRCLVQTTVRDREDRAGELKLRGRAAGVQDPAAIERYCQALQEAIGWRPEGSFHLFALEIESAAFIKYLESGDQQLKEWRPGSPVQERLRRWTGGGLAD
ncbi:MAG: pyridoxamine 5'-phosphate oxidase family protein [Dehalococcoidia bacterium]|nr:pyridoxamine 5'-phosphate oxidase family protein [Dehalococcoidia bacterium]